MKSLVGAGKSGSFEITVTNFNREVLHDGGVRATATHPPALRYARRTLGARFHRQPDHPP